jgi:hypothetical protein
VKTGVSFLSPDKKDSSQLSSFVVTIISETTFYLMYHTKTLQFLFYSLFVNFVHKPHLHVNYLACHRIDLLTREASHSRETEREKQVSFAKKRKGR